MKAKSSSLKDREMTMIGITLEANEDLDKACQRTGKKKTVLASAAIQAVCQMLPDINLVDDLKQRLSK